MLWNTTAVCEGFEAYRDYPEELFGYRWLLREIGQPGPGDGRERIILDFGCGPGKCSLRLASHGCGRVIAVDQSETMLDMARRLRSHPRISYLPVHNDVLDLPDSSVDVAVACFVFINTGSVERIATAMRNIHRVLRPSGELYIVDTNPGTTGVRFSTFLNGSPGHDYQTGETRIVRLFRGDEQCLELQDFHWPRQFYNDQLEQAGFGSIASFEPILDDVPADERRAFFDQHGFDGWKAETSHPPFLLLKASHATTR
jgi:ubiquinone/menaquinone biosynthesis C-methylase UbiE